MPDSTIKKLVSKPSPELLGKKAPAFNLMGTGGGKTRLSTLLGNNVLLYFYPRDNTPGCTTESEEFSALSKQFKKLDTVIFGISQDSLKSHEKFHSKLSLTFELLSDESGDVCTKYGCLKLKKLYGKEFIGIERSTFLIDKKGVVRGEWRKVKVAGHAALVHDALKGLA